MDSATMAEGGNQMSENREGGLWVPHPIFAVIVSLFIFVAGASVAFFRQAAQMESSVAVLTTEVQTLRLDMVDVKLSAKGYRPAAEMVSRTEWEASQNATHDSLSRIERILEKRTN